MNIFLSYGFRPFTTAVYFERALANKHKVTYIGPPYGMRPGYLPNEDVYELTKELGDIDFFLFIEPGINFFPRGLERLRCPTACYLVDVHSSLWVRQRYAPFFDYIFVAQKDYVQHFKNMGYKQVYWLPLACDPDLHGEKMSSRIYDIGFVGQLFNGTHPRNRRLNRLSELYKMNDFSKWYQKEEVTAVYSQSKIVVNIPYSGDLNMRVFEAMASGSLLVTEAIGNGQKELFKDGIHLVEYHTDEELFDKVDYYLKHDDERERIAITGQETVLKKHTYKDRCDFVIRNIFGNSRPLFEAMTRTMKPKNVHIAYAKVYSMLRLIDPVLEEIRQAHNDKAVSSILFVELIKSFMKAVNIIIPFTPSARRMRRNIPRR